jgi:hypothetical protein
MHNLSRLENKNKKARLPEQPGPLILRPRLMIALSGAAGIFARPAVLVLRLIRMLRFGAFTGTARVRIGRLGER